VRETSSEDIMHLLPSSDMERVAGGDALCDIEVSFWGAGSGLIIGAVVGTVASPILGILVGGLVAGSTMGLAVPALCENRETDLSRFSYID
jgi:hypothetical protein